MQRVSMSRAHTHATAHWDTLASTVTLQTVHSANVSMMENASLTALENGLVIVPSSTLVCSLSLQYCNLYSAISVADFVTAITEFFQ